MSASDELFEYHLTQKGWVPGSRKLDFSGWQHQEVPEGRLLTATFREYLSSGFSALGLSADVEKHGDDEAIAKALKAHGTEPTPNANRHRGWPEFLQSIGYPRQP